MKLFSGLICIALFSVASAQAADIRATHCEIFVDKVNKALWQDGKVRNTGMNVFVKVRPEALDGEMRAVGFYHETIEANAYGGGVVHGFETTYLNQIAYDYFHTFLMLRAENLEIAKYGKAEIHRGAFFIETSRGTRYWANPGANDGRNSGPNFTFNWDFMESFWNMRPNLPLHEIPTTGTYEGPGAYLNPSRCR